MKMHADEVETDAALVRRLLVAQFPQWADLPIEPFASTGTVNAIYRLGTDMAVRMPRVERWANDLEKELHWLPKLAPQLPLAVPEPLVAGSPGEGYPWQWAVYRWLDGETWALERVRDERSAAATLAQFINALQRIDTEAAPRPGPQRGRSAEQDTWVRSAIAASRGIVDTEAVTAAWDATLRVPGWDGPPVWVHGDLLAANVLIAGGRLSAVIDFGGMHAGDPARELIAAWALFTSRGREVLRAALAVDDATWERGRGWALTRVVAIPYYRETNPVFAADSLRTIREVLADHESGA